MRFVDVKNDVAFRKIFGNENKTEIIISFLNAVLKLKGDKTIEEVSITDPYQLPRIAGEKASIIDVSVRDKAGRQFVVEMQVTDVNGFDKRVQYYTCRDYSMQINKGDHYPKLKPTFFIGIMDFNYFDNTSYLSNHLILNEETYEHKLTDIKFTFIELKKFNLKEEELKNLIEKWVYFIKNAENLDVIPGNVEDKGLKEAYRDAEKHSWKKTELIAYDNFSIAIQDQRGQITAAATKARTAGKTEGKVEGKREEKIEVVKKCFARKMHLEDIAEITGLSISEIKEIIEQITNQ